ncbi:MAG: HAMP domain-containing histidine kinase [Clostridiales bacterium]|jgi:signal transduction histidine kinase|nr:HAMP domain-containing histidine kinase [Clostridiales bacterium]
MKLWQKIFLCTLVLVILAVDITAVLLLSNHHLLLIQRERVRAMDEHSYFSATIRDKLVYARLKKSELLLDAKEVQETLKKSVEDSNINFVGIYCYRDGREISAMGTVLREPAKELANYARDTQQSMEQNCVQIYDEKDKTYIMAVSTILLEGRYYQMATISDITEVYLLKEEQIRYVQSLSVACAVVIAGILLVVVWRLLRPLNKINEGTRQIAQGHYEKRLSVRGYNELSELASNMNAMAKAVEENVHRLEQVAEDRNTFIANLAHEMKTPLTSILGFADILRVKRFVSNEERQDYANIIVEETRRLRSLSGKLMELITMGSTQLDYISISVEELLREVECSLTPLFSGKEIRLRVFAVEGSLHVDKELFKSLLYNLADNAVKASKPGGEVRLRAFYQKNGRLGFRVEDDGIGIPQKEIEQVVKPFYMLDKSRTRKEGGAGLGLPLCAQIARLHQADLTIQSTVGKGTQVFILFREEAGD